MWILLLNQIWQINKKMKKTFLLLALSLVVFTANAKNRTTQEMRNAAIKALNANRSANAAPRQDEIKELRKMSGLTIFGYNDHGFAVISNDDLLPEVLGVSDKDFSNGENPGFMWWLKAINQVCESTMAKGPANASNVPTPESLGFEPYVDPIVTAEWDQDTPYWNMCPKKNGSTALTGCVATAIAQVLYTHKTPIEGNGTRTNTSWSPVTFDYNGYVPDYDSMIDQYTSGPHAGQYTDEQVEPMAKLMLACGVAVNMSYSSTGSGAYTNDAAEGLIRYMGIATADFKERDYYSDAEWMSMIYEELSGGHAMYYSGVDYSGWQAAGHAFVCDGYDENGKVHINWGWSGSDNGFFNINLLNPVGYSFSSYQDFIMGLWDPNSAPGGGAIDYVDLDITTEAAGTVNDLIGTENYEALRSIVITGEINNEDLAILRRLATGDELTDYDMEGKSHLTTIDLTNAILADNTLPDEAFKGCKILKKVLLPRGLAKIGAYAFNGCSRMSSIRSYTFEVPKTGNRCFEGVNSNLINVYVPAGASEYYRRNAQWKVIAGAENVTEFGTTLKAKSYTRLYDEANPVFGFQLYGDRVVGSPRLWTEATKESAPGTYPIYIEAGSIEESENLLFVNGTLTIKENPASGIVNVYDNDDDDDNYNIAGQRVAADAKGIVIKNGKKVIK